LIKDMDVSEFMSQGILRCTVTLKHPFPGLGQYNGFDVMGVFMHNGSATLGYDNLTYSDGSGSDEALLLNPDGYTRWYNYSEFDGTGPQLLRFWSGKLSNLPAPTAMLNPYKLFADGLLTDDDYYTWISASSNAANRNIFSAGQVNSRRYELKFHNRWRSESRFPVRGCRDMGAWGPGPDWQSVSLRSHGFPIER
jgi:hypothetical protein